jgi:SAM-dependent methyltransferase
MKVQWKQAVKPVTCRLCGFEGSGRQVLTLKTHQGLTIAPVECPVCLSLDIVDEPIPFAESQELVDMYVEVGAGIDAIASLISCIDRPTDSSFVDIGCGYGFSLCLAEGLYGWRAYGYEPSPLAKAGAETLGVDIRHEPFTRESKFTHAPDYVFSSEVIEHIPDPLDFLSTIRAQLPEGAVLVMTTPNRACVDPSVPEPELIGALSPGFHVLVASAQGMRLLAQRAGFAHCVVRENAERLIIAMAHKPSALESFALREVPRVAMDDWYERTMRTTEPGTPLRIGLTSRLLDSFVAQGKFSLARPVADALLEDMTLRFDGFDIDVILAKAQPSIRSSLFPLMVSICYDLGMISLLGDNDPLTAAKHFSSSIAAGEAWFAAGGVQFLALVNMVEQARITRLLALARCAPEEAEREALNQDATGPAPGYLVARTLVEAVAHGHESSIGRLLSAARISAPNLALSDQPAERIAGQDALFMMANVCERNADRADAVELYAACLKSCLAESTQMSHEIDLIRQSHLGLKRCGAPEAPAPRILDLVTHTSPLPLVYFAPEVFWRDAAGVFLEGWVHAGALAVSAIDVRHGDVAVRAEARRRDDLTRLFGDLSPDTRPNFRAYVPRGRGDAIDIVVTTAHGTLGVSWQMPFQNLPAREPTVAISWPFDDVDAQQRAQQYPEEGIQRAWGDER